MDLQQYADLLNRLPQQVEQQALDAIVIPAASRMNANIINRNVNEGKNTDGSKRGAYSNKSGYYGRKAFVKGGAFKPQGKNGTRQGAKTMYLQNGYFQLREIQGRRTDIKNYEYSGDLVKAFQFAKASDGLVVIGFIDEISRRKREGLEKKFGRAFYPSADEIKEYQDEVTRGTRDLNIKILSSIT